VAAGEASADGVARVAVVADVDEPQLATTSRVVAEITAPIARERCVMRKGIRFRSACRWSARSKILTLFSQRSDEIGMLAASSSQSGRVARETHPIGVKPSSLGVIGHSRATWPVGLGCESPVVISYPRVTLPYRATLGRVPRTAARRS